MASQHHTATSLLNFTGFTPLISHHHRKKQGISIDVRLMIAFLLHSQLATLSTLNDDDSVTRNGKE